MKLTIFRPRNKHLGVDSEVDAVMSGRLLKGEGSVERALWLTVQNC